MPLQDVSNDPNMLGWLQTAGHGHLLADRFRSTSPTYGGDHHLDGPMRSSSSHVQNSSFGSPVNFQSSSFHQPSYGHSPPPPNFQSSSFHQPSYGHSPPPPNFQSSSFHQSSYGNSPPPILPRPQGSYGGITSNSPLRFLSSPLNYNSGTQFLAPNTHQQQLDVDIEAMRRDPNTRVVQRPPGEDVVYKQRVFVRYLQPPTPPVGGTIIVREKQAPPPPPDPPIVLRRAPPPPPTPPPVIIRERPPPVPPPEGTTIIDKIIPSFQKPPRQVIVEQYPPLPPKPQDVIIERWLPVPPRHRKILYERLPHSLPPQAAAPIIIQHGQPNVRVVKEVITNAPHNQLVPHVAHTDINHILSGLGVQQYQTAGSSLLSPSSLVCYSPYSTMQPTIGYSTSHQPQSNVIVLQGGAQHMLPSSSYAAPMTCVVNNPNILSTGLGSYGGGISTFPMTGTLPGQSIVCHVPDNVPVDSVLRQLGIDPVALQRSSYYSPHAGTGSSVTYAIHVC
ncbi:unnamed protein product [Didymodactylos carnosus]|uniref:Uncharacterized protein n=1 Tax=Didymodactylos carnosus TaxID=1234261 RepID=A0A813XEG2_9BILA|nr:unnamed protein product [Didymodactylos carnosus]CAF3661831.1 unnamed protein product [Didymodactylos carnosus]